MTTPEQWAAKMLAEFVACPSEPRREVATKYVRAAVNEALRRAAYRLSEIHYCKPYSTEPAKPEERVLDLLDVGPTATSHYWEAGRSGIEEPQFSDDGSVGIFPKHRGYEVIFKMDS